MTTSPYIAVTREDGVLFVQIQRPDKRNALDEAMFAALATAFTDAQHADDIAAVLIHGIAGCFSAGHDLAAFATLWPQPADGAIVRCIDALIQLHKPLIAAVDGAAVGFGATLLLHADYVAASARATFRFPFADLGIVPEAGSSALLARRVGDLCARDWLLSARVIDAHEALAKGFVSHVFADADTLSAATRYARQLAAKPAGATQQIRRLLDEGATRTASEAAAAEVDALNILIPAIAAHKRT